MLRLLGWICCPVKFDAEQSTCTRLGDCTSMHNLPIFWHHKELWKAPFRRGTKFGTPREKVAPASDATRMGLHNQKFQKTHCEYLSLLKEIELNFNISADFHFHLLLFLPSACKGCTYHQRLGKGPQTAVPCHKASDVVPQQKSVETLPWYYL